MRQWVLVLLPVALAAVLSACSPLTPRPASTTTSAAAPTTAAPGAKIVPASDKVSKALAAIGFECFTAWTTPINVVECHRFDDGLESVATFQLVNGAWVDGDLNAHGSSPEKWQAALKRIVTEIVPVIAPDAAANAAKAVDAGEGNHDVTSSWGTVIVKIATGGGTVTLTGKGTSRTTIPAAPWPGTIADAQAALTAVGWTCTATADLECTSGSDKYNLVTNTSGLNYVSLRPGTMEASTPAIAKSAPLFTAVAGPEAGPAITAALAQYVDGKRHAVQVHGYDVLITQGSILVQPNSWTGLH